MPEVLQDFKKFILRGNVVDLAVGVLIGAAFNNVVAALTKDILTPLIAAIFGKPDFSRLSFTLHNSTFAYGDLINAVISFLITATTVYFFVVVPINKLTARFVREPLPDPTLTKCPECLSDIPKESRRCRFCTTQLKK